mgnify:CR=1 FL=1
MTTIRLGVLGCGNVGAALVRLVGEQADAIEARSGVRLEVAKVAVRNLSAQRAVALPEGVLTRDAAAVVADPDIDMVIELIGGIEPARELITTALRNGKPVVTGNKELLANVGAELFAVAEECGVDLLFEAAVAGGIPVVRALRESLLGEPISRVMGIINGTTNFILTKMTEEGTDYTAALAEAQALGYAERDPTADVEGFDAGAKAAIIATIAFGSKVVAGDVYHEGISRVSAHDISMATRLGYVVKLLGIAEADAASGDVAVRVHPTLVPNTHPLASVRSSFNAVFVEGEAVGSLMFYGRGAGGAPTASAVLGDVVAVARHIVAGSKGPAESDYADLGIAPKGASITKYAIRMAVHDKPGVLANVANTFASEDVSIQTVRQAGRGSEAELIVATHAASDSALSATVKELSGNSSVKNVESVLRIEGVVN